MDPLVRRYHLSLECEYASLVRGRPESGTGEDARRIVLTSDGGRSSIEIVGQREASWDQLGPTLQL